jgi:hypothetical protein
MDGRRGMASRQRTESFLLVLDPLPLRLRGLAGTELPVLAGAVADVAAALGARAAGLGRLAYILAEYDWDINFAHNFMLEARRVCRQIDVERMFAAHPELAAAANVYLEEGLTAAGRLRQRELFWAEDESRLVAA